MQSQNNDSQDEMSSNQKTHMERNRNLIYDCYRDTKRKAETSKCTQKTDNQETVETNNQTRIDLQEQE